MSTSTSAHMDVAESRVRILPWTDDVPAASRARYPKLKATIIYDRLSHGLAGKEIADRAQLYLDSQPNRGTQVTCALALSQ